MSLSKKIFSSIFLSLTILLTISFITLLILNESIKTSYLLIHIFLIILCTVLFYVYAKENQYHKIKLSYIWTFFFLLYILFLAYLLFFSKDFLRDQFVFEKFSEYLTSIKTQWQYGTNIIPFASIKDMIHVMNLPAYSGYSITNLYGNIIAFMPFSFFAIVLFHLSFKRFLLIISLIVVLVEFTQFFTFTGALDIDDFILNVSGAIICYGLLYPIKNKLHK